MDLASTLFGGALIAFVQEFIGSIGARWRDRIEWKHTKRFVELAIRKLLPDPIDGLLRRKALLSLLFLILVVAGAAWLDSRPARVVRFFRRAVPVHVEAGISVKQYSKEEIPRRSTILCWLHRYRLRRQVTSVLHNLVLPCFVASEQSADRQKRHNPNEATRMKGRKFKASNMNKVFWGRWDSGDS